MGSAYPVGPHSGPILTSRTFTEESFRRLAHPASALARVSGEAQHCPSTQIAEPVRPGWPESFAEVGRPSPADSTANGSI